MLLVCYKNAVHWCSLRLPKTTPQGPISIFLCPITGGSLEFFIMSSTLVPGARPNSYLQSKSHQLFRVFGHATTPHGQIGIRRSIRNPQPRISNVGPAQSCRSAARLRKSGVSEELRSRNKICMAPPMSASSRARLSSLPRASLLYGERPEKYGDSCHVSRQHSTTILATMFQPRGDLIPPNSG